MIMGSPGYQYCISCHSRHTLGVVQPDEGTDVLPRGHPARARGPGASRGGAPHVGRGLHSSTSQLNLIGLSKGR